MSISCVILQLTEKMLIKAVSFYRTKSFRHIFDNFLHSIKVKEKKTMSKKFIEPQILVPNAFTL